MYAPRMSDVDANPNASPANPPTAKKKRDELEAELAAMLAKNTALEEQLAEQQRIADAARMNLADRLEDERDAAASRAERLAAEEAQRAAAPPRLLGTINVYDTDRPQDVLRRADEVRAGKIPAEKATRFKVDSVIHRPKSGPLADKFTTPTLPLGTIVHRDDVSADDLAEFIKAGAFVPVG